MNVAAVKLACWITSIATTFGLSAFVYDFYKRKESLYQPIDESYVVGVLDKGQEIQPETVDRLERAQMQRAMELLNWTGAPPAAAVQATAAQVEDRPPVEPVERILSLAMIQFSRWAPDKSSIHARFLKAPAGVLPELHLFTGDSLPSPYDYVRVQEIRVDGVDFAFADETRPVETLVIGGDDLPLIVYIGPDGVPQSESGFEIPLMTQDVFRPERTTPRRKDYYVIGTEDAAYLEQNYATVLTNDLRYGVYRDPLTGKRAGIQVHEVKPGSVAERHGLQSGDAILSINGHPVTSDQEALQYARTNKDKYTVWEVELLRQGRKTTLRYENPN